MLKDRDFHHRVVVEVAGSLCPQVPERLSMLCFLEQFRGLAIVSLACVNGSLLAEASTTDAASWVATLPEWVTVVSDIIVAVVAFFAYRKAMSVFQTKASEKVYVLFEESVDALYAIKGIVGLLGSGTINHSLDYKNMLNELLSKENSVDKTKVRKSLEKLSSDEQLICSQRAIISRAFNRAKALGVVVSKTDEKLLEDCLTKIMNIESHIKGYLTSFVELAQSDDLPKQSGMSYRVHSMKHDDLVDLEMRTLLEAEERNIRVTSDEVSALTNQLLEGKGLFRVFMKNQQ